MNRYSISAAAPIFRSELYRADDVTFNLIDGINESAFLRESDGRSFLLCRNSMDFPAWIWTADDITPEEFAVLADRLRLHFADIAPHFVAKNGQLARLCSLFAPYTVEKRLALTAYRLRELRMPAISQTISPITPDEEALLVPFAKGFTLECFGHCEDAAAAALAKRHANSGRTYALRLGGVPVSVACWGDRGRYQDVAFVYTEKQHRGKGYAAQVVATVCRQIQSHGGTAVLYADGDNPISNHLYIRLGFEQTGQTTELRLKRAE